MVERSSLTRATFLSDRLEEVERGVALLAEGGVVANVEIRDPEGNLEKSVSIMFEKPVAVPGLGDALGKLQAQLQTMLAEVGVGLGRAPAAAAPPVGRVNRP